MACKATDMGSHTEMMARSIKEQMRSRSWSIADLAVASGIPPKRLAERLTGLTDFHLSEMSALADAFGITLPDLIQSVSEQKIAA